MSPELRGNNSECVYFHICATPLAHHHCGFETRQGLWILSYEEAVDVVYGTSVVLLRCPFVPEIMDGRAPEVESIYCVSVT
jgi:hypothetical protein